VQTIDDDQGRSGQHADHRHGFKRLRAEIGAGPVGVVLAREASRLARSSVDWHRLVEICVVTHWLSGIRPDPYHRSCRGLRQKSEQGISK